MFSGIDDDLILCSWEPIETYYSCIYDSLRFVRIFEENYLNILKEYEDSNNLIYSLCVKIIYFKEDYSYSLLCLDINFGLLINSIKFPKTKNIDLGLAKNANLYKEPYYDLSSIYNTNRNLNEIFEVFNS